MKYGIWLDEWFRNYIQPSSKIKTCERYSEIIEKHLKVNLGEYELDELTPLVLQRYVTELMQSGNIVTGKGLAANSVNGIITVIQNSLKLAYTLGELKEYTANNQRNIWGFFPTDKDNQRFFANEFPVVIHSSHAVVQRFAFSYKIGRLMRDNRYVNGPFIVFQPLIFSATAVNSAQNALRSSSSFNAFAVWYSSIRISCQRLKSCG